MPKFPYPPYQYYQKPYYANSYSNVKNITPNIENNNHQDRNSLYNNKKVTNNNEKDSSIFELFGFKLYYDDILILCILYFLYSENIKDEWLFVALLLLLIT